MWNQVMFSGTQCWHSRRNWGKNATEKINQRHEYLHACCCETKYHSISVYQYFLLYTPITQYVHRFSWYFIQKKQNMQESSKLHINKHFDPNEKNLLIFSPYHKSRVKAAPGFPFTFRSKQWRLSIVLFLTDVIEMVVRKSPVKVNNAVVSTHKYSHTSMSPV